MSDFTKLHRIERVDVLNRVSAKAIGVWSMLHHALDRRGRIALGGVDYASVLLRRLPIDKHSRQWFHAGLRELEEAGAFVVEGGTFQLVGHAGANEPEKTRKEQKPESAPVDLPSTFRQPPVNLPTTSGQPSDNLSLASDGNHSLEQILLLKNRIEESRIDTPIVPCGDGGGFELSAEKPAKPKPERRKPQLAGTAKVLADAMVSEAAKRELVYPIVPSSALSQVAKWLEAQCALSKCSIEAGAEALARGFFSAKYPIESGYPWGLFLTQHASYWPAGQIRVLANDQLAERRRELERQRREARSDLARYEALGKELEALR